MPAEKENTVPEVNIFAVMEEVPEVRTSVAEVVAYKGTEKLSSVRVSTSTTRIPPARHQPRGHRGGCPGQLRAFCQPQLPRRAPIATTPWSDSAFHCLTSSGIPGLLTHPHEFPTNTSYFEALPPDTLCFLDVLWHRHYILEIQLKSKMKNKGKLSVQS